jgi:hypothetical protein
MVSVDRLTAVANLNLKSHPPQTTETLMQDVITIGKRLIPVEQIAFAEPFDAASNPDFKSDKPFKARVVLVNRDTVLAEIAVQEFADAHGFRLLAEDSIAVNPGIAFRVETFEPSESFRPEKAYVSRLKWRDADGNEHSKLLLTPPERVIAVALRGEAEPAMRTATRPPARSRAFRRTSRKPTLVRA